VYAIYLTVNISPSMFCIFAYLYT